ncbi:hypothetical protein IQ249_01965 [Lusitaniella coriacea LEGE 07157]|uniref:Uncharacterized protein n=2 Tax=Lusitaniella TaxID=1983104 RepID=A0A8J7DLB6_9CYAN|nr:hypothetical protein [Lusitaniella coriacea]MBE9114653.1 hypothetical protein [Lusitaniella coriacea LEGE 07157]
MKLNARNALTSAASIALVLGMGAIASYADTIALRTLPNQQVTLSGRSGGSQKTPDCGFVSAAPSHLVNVTERINSMTLRVEATGGQPTLLIDGPDGRFCATTTGGNSPEIPGLWMPGLYKISVGDLSGEQHAYSLQISQ